MTINITELATSLPELPGQKLLARQEKLPVWRPSLAEEPQSGEQEVLMARSPKTSEVLVAWPGYDYVVHGEDTGMYDSTRISHDFHQALLQRGLDSWAVGSHYVKQEVLDSLLKPVIVNDIEQITGKPLNDYLGV